MKKITGLLSALFLAILIVTMHTASAKEITKKNVSDAQIQQNILKLVNQYRVSHGLNALKMNEAISEEASRHSRDMAIHRIPFGHQYFPDRIKRLYAQINNCRAGAENVAYNYKDTNELVRQWLKSPGHRRNIDGHYNLTGIGIARDKNGKIYYTQMFLRTDEIAKNH